MFVWHVWYDLIMAGRVYVHNAYLVKVCWWVLTFKQHLKQEPKKEMTADERLCKNVLSTEGDGGQYKLLSSCQKHWEKVFFCYCPSYCILLSLWKRESILSPWKNNMELQLYISKNMTVFISITPSSGCSVNVLVKCLDCTSRLKVMWHC